MMLLGKTNDRKRTLEKAIRMHNASPQARTDHTKTVKRHKCNPSAKVYPTRNHLLNHAKDVLVTTNTEFKQPAGSYELITENRLATKAYIHETNNSLMRAVHLSEEGNTMKALFSWDNAHLIGSETLVNENGILLLGTLNLARMMGLPNCPQPSRVKHDCILISNDDPMAVLLCHYKDADVTLLMEYGRILARELVHVMRNYTDESFNILFDVIEESLVSPQKLSQYVKKLVESNRIIYPFERLRMNEHKKKKLFASFLDVLSTTEVDLSQCDDGPDLKQNREDRLIHLLNQEEFDVMGHIMGGEERVIHVHVKTSLQRNFFALEVARRLNQDGGTLLITTNSFTLTAFCKSVKPTCSQCDLEDAKHVVELSSSGNKSDKELKLQYGGKHVVIY